MEVALQLVTHNSSKYLPFLFDSLRLQTDVDWRLWIIDCGSSEAERVRTRELTETLRRDFAVEYFEDENIGFDGGHDLLFQKHSADAVLLMNPDIIFTPNYIATVRNALEQNADVGAITGLIYRWEWDEGGKPRLTQKIDSFGMARSRSHKVFDRTEITAHPAFGVSGCLPMYRRSAIEENSPDGHLFDQAYFMYKEDVDVAYRLSRGGWNTLCVSEAIAYHHRDFRASILHRGASVRSRHLSYRNHWWNLITHLEFQDWLRDGWAIIPFEFAKFGFFLLTRPSILLRTLCETHKQWQHLMKRRSALKTLTKSL